MKNVVVIGGGTGLSVMLRGLKQIEDINLTAIVTVADDGGSTGRIRRQYPLSCIPFPKCRPPAIPFRFRSSTHTAS